MLLNNMANHIHIAFFPQWTYIASLVSLIFPYSRASSDDTPGSCLFHFNPIHVHMNEVGN